MNARDTDKVVELDDSARAARMRRRLHDAARRAFSELGRQVQIDDVVRIAGVARGTFYNYFRTVDELFEHVAAELARDMGDRVDSLVRDIPDPARRMSSGIRYFCQRAHADRDWGMFLAHFGMSADTLFGALRDTAVRDIEEGIAAQRFRISPDQTLSAIALISGAVLGSIKLVVAGSETPLRAGENAAELGLRALGIGRQEARRLARAPLVPLGISQSDGMN